MDPMSFQGCSSQKCSRGGVGWVMVGWGWGGSCRGGVGHAGVEWVMLGWVGHVGVGWIMQGWVGLCWGGVGWVM